ncbi:type II secretion system protein D [Escherichia coli]|uniref:Type II secretion system protein D n=1 Tax=Escherichia coli TaxID=562 RepID=A0A376NUS2_ECOLX|nr:type II secretion system protein D [Escherichia coli]
MQSLQSVIEQLDIRRAQVHVEALIVEVAEGSNITSACSGRRKMPD